MRVSISDYETLISNAFRRSIRLDEPIACPRVSDLPYLIASLGGKIELETFGEGREDRLVDDLTKRATLAIFGRHCDVDALDDIVTSFDLGNAVETGSDVPATAYVDALARVDGLTAAVEKPDRRRPASRGYRVSRRIRAGRSASEPPPQLRPHPGGRFPLRPVSALHRRQNAQPQEPLP